MTDAPAPPKKSGPGRWILLGCGLFTAFAVLGMGSCAGLFYLVHKRTDPIAQVGSDYLQGSQEVQKAFGPVFSVRRNMLGSSVHLTKDRGSARFKYSIQGARQKGESEAIVWLDRKGGKWLVVRARVTSPQGEDINLGSPPEAPSPRLW